MCVYIYVYIYIYIYIFLRHKAAFVMVSECLFHKNAAVSSREIVCYLSQEERIRGFRYKCVLYECIPIKREIRSLSDLRGREYRQPPEYRGFRDRKVRVHAP